MFINVQKSFYTAFDGRCCYCTVENLICNYNDLQFSVSYSHGDEERYNLVSRNGVCYSGVAGMYYNKVNFEVFKHENMVVLSGTWKCGDNEGEWYIEGVIETKDWRGLSLIS